MKKEIKYLCKCGGRFDKPETKKQNNESCYVCPMCKTLIGLPKE